MPYIVKYSLKRFGLMLLTAFIIISITFFLVMMLPDAAISGNDAAQLAFCRNQVSLGYYLSFQSEQSGLGSTVIAPLTDQSGTTWYFYQKPIIQRYFAWLTNIFTNWDWGTSTVVQPGTTGMSIIASRLQPTILINVFALLISLPLGFACGILAALKKNSATDNIISTVVMIFISVPSFVTISLLMLWLCYTNTWLPDKWPSGSVVTTAEYVQAMVIPVLALCFGTVAVFTRYTRAELTEVMSSDFLLLARTKGLSKNQCVVRHALRNSMVPIVPMIIGQFIGILSGSVVLEQLYSIPGIGSLYVQCLNAKDYNVLLVDMTVFTMISLVANLLVDLSYGIVDPRIRMGAKAS